MDHERDRRGAKWNSCASAFYGHTLTLIRLAFIQPKERPEKLLWTSLISLRGAALMEAIPLDSMVRVAERPKASNAMRGTTRQWGRYTSNDDDCNSTCAIPFRASSG